MCVNLCSYLSCIYSSSCYLSLRVLGEGRTTDLRIIDRWSCHTSLSVTCGDSPRESAPELGNYGSLIVWYIQVSDLWQLAKGKFTLTWELWIGDLVIDPSQWLVVTRQGRVHLDLRMIDRWFCDIAKSVTCGDLPRGSSHWLGNYGLVILSLIQVSDLWRLAMGCSHWLKNYGSVMLWFSISVTCGDSARGIFLDLIMLDRWSGCRHESVSRRNSPEG